MLTIALAVLLAAQAAEEPFVDDSPATLEESQASVARKLSRCGIRPDQLRTEIDAASGGSAVLIVTPAAKLTAPTYVCLARAEMEDNASVAFDDPEATQLFWQAHPEASRESARDALQKAGLLTRLPLYDPAKQSLADYARALEKLCGVAPGKGFTVSGPAWLTVPDAMVMEGEDAPSPCLLDAAGASNLHEHGVTFGIP